MKQIVAYVKPNKLTAVSLALRKLTELPGMSYCEVRGFGRDRVQNAHPTLVQDLVDYAPYVRVEVFCHDERAFEIRYMIQNAARTGHNGDGMVYVLDVCQAVRIQTDERVDVAA